MQQILKGYKTLAFPSDPLQSSLQKKKKKKKKKEEEEREEDLKQCLLRVFTEG